ncbi:MAG TPA: type 1 glutamine amidotransferase [Acidothermaceae bacterium]|nr:type 1 glutamine amidotransferase [Acidothermaceae bacterium]
MNAPWVVVQHVPVEGPGLIAVALERAGARVDVRRMYCGEPLPAADEIAGLVVMGGPMNALDDAAFPHLPAERQLLAACVQREVPVLAVCLGAQLLAAALGARVYRGDTPEVGLGVVTLAPAARHDPVFGPAGHLLPVLHWHEDTFELPAGATLLASNAAYPHQAYRVGSAYAMQFHLEIDAAALPDLAPALPPDAHIDHRHLALVNRAGAALFDRFVAGAMQRTGRPLAGSNR